MRVRFGKLAGVRRILVLQYVQVSQIFGQDREIMADYETINL